MRVFVTGATGFVGSALVSNLIATGHQILGLARSDAAAASLVAAGAQAHRGSLEDLQSLRNGAAGVDAVIHAGFIHDFARFVENSEVDRRAILALAEELAGSGRPLIVTSGVGFTPGRARTEEDPPNPPSAALPRVSEQAALEADAQGCSVRVIRLPQVHDPRRQGFITYAIAIAREKGLSAYVGDGANRLSAVHRLDAAQLYRLVLEQGESGARYHAVAEEGVPIREIAEAIGRRFDLPVASISREEAGAHFGWLGGVITIDMPASSALTRDRLGWRPNGPGLVSDIDQAIDQPPS